MPEATKDNDLEPSIQGILNTILSKNVTDPLRFHRVHHTLRPCNITANQPRDVICRLHYFKDKNTIKLQGILNIDFDGAVYDIFSDLFQGDLRTPQGTQTPSSSAKSRWCHLQMGLPLMLYCHQKWPLFYASVFGRSPRLFS